jgi:F-type H+-transporting ATPase subunit delta
MNENGEQPLEPIAGVGAERVARVYAEALLNAAEKRNQAGEVLEELDSLVRDVFAANPDFEKFLASRAVSRDHKPPVIRRALEGRASEVFLNFVLVLNDHDRLDLLRPILRAYRDLYDERHGRVRALVRSALPLDDDQRDRLRQELRAAFGKEPVLEARTDPDLLGGLVVQVGDWLYDASVRTRIENLRKEIIERSSHEIQRGRDRFSH